MKYPTTRFIFDRRKKCSSADTPGYIDLEISFYRKRKWISTGVAVLPSQWDNSRLIISRPDSIILTERIKAVKKPVDDYINNLLMAGLPFTFEEFDRHLRLTNNTSSFIDYLELKISNRKDIRESSRKAQRKIITSLKLFGGITTFASLTKQAIKSYDAWLHEHYSCQATIHGYHKTLKTYINMAISEELMKTSPYIGIKIERGKSVERKYLTEDEIQRLETVTGLPDTIARVRDLFLFQCYTGLAYADLARFDFTRVVRHGDRYILHDQRHKTSESFYIVLIAPAMKILSKYDCRLPVISNQQYNMRLKILAEYARLDRRLTSHMGRHSFACMALNHGLPMEVVSRALGHTNTNTTQLYAKLTNKTMERAFAHLEQAII